VDASDELVSGSSVALRADDFNGAMLQGLC
jgi:hypothetical protein